MPSHRWISVAAALGLLAPASSVLASSRTILRSGSPYTIDVWDTEDGLPQNSVISMIQARDGYLWLGTLNGLARFDGIHFRVFDEFNTPGLNSSRIVRLFEDSQGSLWIGTETAGVALAHKNGPITALDFGRGNRESRLASICEDTGGAIWLYSADGQLCRYRDGRVDVWGFGSQGFSAYRAVVAQETGAVLVGMDWRLCMISPVAGLSPTNLPVVQNLPISKLDFLLASQRGGYWRLAEGRVQKWGTNRLELDWGGYPWKRSPVSAACEDGLGNLVVGTLGEGLFWFDSQGKATGLSTNEGLSHSIILSLHVDREGSLWVGTDGGGLNRVKRQIFSVLEETRDAVVQSVCEDNSGGLWFGCNGREAGFWKDNVLQRFGPQQGLLNLYVRSMFVDREQGVWAGTSGGGLFQFQDTRFRLPAGVTGVNPAVSAMFQDRSGRLWVGTQGGLACRDERGWRGLTTRDGLSADVVRAIAEDADGNLWVGTVGGGLNRLRDGRFTAFHMSDGLPGEDISSLLVDRAGVLWIGTYGRGLGRFFQGKWKRYTTREGLVSNSVGYLIEDDQGFLWIGSNAGLMRVPKKSLNDFAAGLTASIECRAFGKSDGLPMAECTFGSQPGACRTREGKLWFPTIKGLVSVNPAQIPSNTNPPPVTIESVLVGREEKIRDVLLAESPLAVAVPAGRDRVEIQYTSLNLSAPERARFKYRLENHDSDWIEAGNTRSVHYSRLPPGPYRFQVTACNEDGVWNPAPCSLDLNVEPPFWRTWWFLTGASVALLGAIVGIVHYFSTQKLERQLQSLKQKEALEKERSRIARDIHDQLGANLTRISLLGELVESDKELPGEVEEYAQQIIRTARNTTESLDEIVWAANPSNDTLDSLVTYICKHAQEYLDVAGLRYRLDVPPQLPATPIPPEVRHHVFLASKEAVTNVVRHAQATEATLRLLLEPPGFTLEIKDNGRGLPADGGKAGRNGLRNMRKRMEDVGGNFSITTAPEGGTLVRLTVPLVNR